MKELLVNPEFWKAITAIVWPVVVLIIFFVCKPFIKSILTKENLTIEVAGMKISVAEAAKNIGKDLTDLQQRMSDLEVNSTIGLIKNNNIDDSQNISKSSQKTRIIWVDDYPSNNAFIVDHFQKNGIFVDISLSTNDALDKIRNIHYNAVISDLGRKEDGKNNSMAGLDLVRMIRNNNINIPILIFAGRRGLENRDLLISAGANEVTASGTEVISFVQSVQTR